MKSRLMIVTLGLLWVPSLAYGWQIELHSDLAMERLSGQSISALDAGFVAQHGALEIGWNIPIRADLTNTQLRQRDWDEQGEWSRLLPTLSFKRPTEDGRLTEFQLRIGPTAGATIGHGSIVRDYRSALLIDHFKSALQVEVDAQGVGLQVLVADVTRASLVASRLFFRPRVGARTGEGLTIGITAAADRKAPVSNRRNAQGKSAVLASERPDQDRAPLVLTGIDLSLPWSLGEQHHLVPYVDLNVATVADGGGGGIHTGIWWSYQAAGLSLQARWELRVSQGTYRAGWIDDFYELERIQLGSGAPKAQGWLERDGSRLLGHLTEINARWRGWRFKGLWETWHSAPNAPDDTATLRLQTPVLWNAQGHLSWSLRPGSSQHALAMATHWQSQGPWHAFVRINRTWAAQNGRFDQVWNGAIGGGMRWRW